MTFIDQTSLTGLAAVGWLAAQPTTLVIRAVDPVGPVVMVRHGDGLIDDTGQNTGGWQFTKRPRRTSMSEYMGVDPYTLKVPVVLDGYITDTPVEATWETLRGIMRNRVGPRHEPAVVTVTGALMRYPWLSWVIQNLETKLSYARPDGARTYIEADMTLYQYASTDLVGNPQQQSPAQAVAQGVQQSGTGSAKTYVVKRGDSLSLIAKNLLGNAARWRDLQALNNLRDPDHLTVGQVLRIP